MCGPLTVRWQRSCAIYPQALYWSPGAVLSGAPELSGIGTDIDVYIVVNLWLSPRKLLMNGASPPYVKRRLFKVAR